MRVRITIDPMDPHAEFVREEAEWWLRNRDMRDWWSVRESEDLDGREVLSFDFYDPLDALDFHGRLAPSEHRGKIL